MANGYFYGTVTIGVQTTYTFTIDAKDAENQDATRTFSMTVTVVPQTRIYSFGKNGVPLFFFSVQLLRSVLHFCFLKQT